MDLPFRLDLMHFLADHRTPGLTGFFQLFTFLGEIEGYVLLIALVYATYDKRLAFRLAVLTLVTMSVNHFLKTLVMNPRPFVTEGTHLEKWAVSPAKAADLVTEFSTPSGHAMAGGAFYAYLYAVVRIRWLRVACVALILLTGLSRPYLGVHYLEDVLIGWVLGIAIALFAAAHAERIGRHWDRYSHAQQVGIAVAASAVLWLFTRAASGWQADGQPSAFVAYAGFLTGIVAAHPVESKAVGFDPRSSTVAKKALRYALSVGMVIGTLFGLDEAFRALSAETTPLGDLLRYVRYATAGIVGFLAAPLVCVKLGLAEKRAQKG